MTKIQKLHLKGIGGIDDLILNFNDNMNVICGPNGIGKTTILECIAQSFSHYYNEFLRRKSDHDSGTWELTIDNNETFRAEKRNFHPNDNKQFFGPYNFGNVYASEIISFRTHRNFEYIPLDSIRQDSKNDDSQMLISGVRFEDCKNWFVHRHLWSAHPNAISDSQRSNLEFAKTIFNKIDKEVTFSRVKGNTHDIMLTQIDGSEIYFEYLSSGYKSLIFIILGLIKEIELRFSDKNVTADQFSGVVLIDEIDLHLHPRWQNNLTEILKSLFPKTQFIASTHSPHVIQTTEPDEVIALQRDESGHVILRDIPSNKYGFQGWSVEEILLDVMGIQETKSPLFIECISEFENALDVDDYKKGLASYKILDEMLHPNNHLRKLLKIQLAALGSEEDD
jgi:predicted ATP-binding protein involved in virulence